MMSAPLKTWGDGKSILLLRGLGGKRERKIDEEVGKVEVGKETCH